jgi:hypothetical protein
MSVPIAMSSRPTDRCWMSVRSFEKYACDDNTDDAAMRHSDAATMRRFDVLISPWAARAAAAP